MKTKSKSGKTFRSIVAMSLASACLLFTACEKETSVLNPEQGVNNASSNSNSALISEYDTKMKEQLSLLPLGEKPIDIAAKEIEQSLNIVYSRLQGNPQFQTANSFITDINVNNGEVSFLEEQRWLLESAESVGNIVLSNANEQIFAIDVLVETLNDPTVVQVKTVIYTVRKITGPLDLGISCQYTGPERPVDIADANERPVDPFIALANKYNFCENGIFNIFSIPNYVILETRSARFTPQTHPHYYYADQFLNPDNKTYMYNSIHPKNKGQFVGGGKLSTVRLNDHIQGLSDAIDDNPPGTGPILSNFQDEWVAVVQSVGFQRNNSNEISFEDHHTAGIIYVKRRKL
tara:strand:- start:3257 stop:4300 length:1044 start_codon:yes stop_codon:yes gene_type:complete